MKYKAPFRVEMHDYEGFAIYDANDDYVPAETIVELLNSQQVPEEYTGGFNVNGIKTI